MSEFCEAMCWIDDRGVGAACDLAPGHEGSHWDQAEGWEW